MRTVLLQLNKTVVFERIALTTAYYGVRNDETPCYDRVALVEADRPWVEDTLRNAFQRLRNLFAPFLWDDLDEAPDSTAFVLRLRVPPTVTPSHLDRWTILGYAYLEAFTLAEWFGICAPAMAVTWQERRDDCWQQLSTSAKLYHRRARVRLPPI